MSEFGFNGLNQRALMRGPGIEDQLNGVKRCIPLISSIVS
jgi:hypothetical protein